MSGVGEAHVHAELQQIFEDFIYEGNQRGITVDFNAIPVDGLLDSSLEASITGQCQHDSDNPDRVIINRNYWMRSDERQREFLVFHELGHCYLKRSHMDKKNSRGECLSIMHSSASVCENAYSDETRETLLR